MAGYTRQSTYTDGDVIQASDSNTEFDQVLAAFNNSTGHAHDGTTAEGPVIGLIGDAGITTPLNKIAVDTGNDRLSFYIDVSAAAVEQLRVEDGVAYPVTNNDIDLGTSVFMFKDGYFAGLLEAVNLQVTNIKANDGTVAGSIADSTGIFTIASAVLTTADINGGTADNVIIGGTTAAAGNFTTLGATGDITVGGTVDGRDLATDGTKLDGIEASADVTGTVNVTASGALMDSELTDITAIKALNQGVATTDTPTFAGIITGGSVDGRDLSVDGTKLDGVEALADVTDVTNVTAAGALMDSELSSIAAVKALNQGVATTDSPVFVGVTTTVTGTVSSIANHDTDALVEGATNLYYTDARADAAIDARVDTAFVDALNVDAATLDGDSKETILETAEANALALSIALG
jgi:hypothetical protein